MKILKNKWTIIGVLVAAIGLLTAFSYESKKTPQYFTEKVQKGDIQNVVQATGNGGGNLLRILSGAESRLAGPD